MNLQQKIVKISVLIYVFFGANIQAQEIRFEQITNESGRTLGFVSGMVQDQTGFIWLATRGGLYKYDGYAYKLFKHNRKDSLSIPYNDVTYLYLDNRQNLWMRHYNRLFVFNNEQLSYEFPQITEKKYDITTQILQDKFDRYWIGPLKDLIIRHDFGKSLTDTFALATKIAHPAIVKWLKDAEPVFFADKEKAFQNNKEGIYLVVSAGEGAANSYYDYGLIERNGKVVFDARNEFCPIQKGSLLHLGYKVLKLSPGDYDFSFIQDESNDFDSTEVPMDYGIAIYEVPQTGEVAQLAAIDYYPDNSIHAAYIKGQIINNEGYYTILTENGLHEFADDGWHSIPLNVDSFLGNAYKNESYSMPFTQTADQTYWIGCHLGLIEVSAAKARLHRIFETPHRLYNIVSDRFNRIWIGSSTGMCRYDPLTGQHTIIRQTNENRLYSNHVWTVMEDHARNMWIATMEGLNKLRPPWFEHIDLNLNNFSPFPLLTTQNRELIAAGQSSYLHLFNAHKPIEKKILLPNEAFPIDNLTNEPEYDITDLLVDGQKLYAAYDNRVALFNHRGEELVRYIEIPNLLIDNQEVSNHALYIFSDANLLWIVAVDGLYSYDRDLKEQLHFIGFGHTFTSILDVDNRFVKSIAKVDNEWFIRTALSLLRFDVKNLQMNSICEFSEFNFQTSLADGNLYQDSINNRILFSVIPEIYSLDIDSYDIDTMKIDLEVDLGNCNTYFYDSLIWVTTNNGLIRFNPKNSDFVRYTTEDGLPDNNVNGVFPDKHGFLWITGIKGLSKMNVAEERFENFFRTNDYNSFSFLEKHLKHPDLNNIKLLPTTTGVFKFNPDSLNSIVPNIVVSTIYLFGKETAFDSLAHQKRHIELPYKQNFITFELASLDYTEPSKNQFRYMLENFSDQWIYTDAVNRKAVYNGLPPGDYVFVAQGTNNDGVWSKPLRVQLIINPPWYRTTIAYIAYVIFSVLFIVLFIRFRERKLKEEKRILEEKVRERTAEIAKQRDEIVAQKKDITDSIHYASRIQAALLPSEDFAKSVLDSYFILFKPRDIVSGDYYWLAQVGTKTIVVAADCTGHGVPGAFMSMLGVAFLNEVVIRDGTLTANKILDKLREHVIKSLKQTGESGGSKDGMDLSLLIIDHDTLDAQFAGAYNPLYLIRNGELETIKADKMPIGYHIKVGTPFSNNELKLEKGDRLYMFSDGYPDQFGGTDGRKFMSKQFKQLLLDTQNLEMQEQKRVLDETIEAWKGDKHSQIDDILVVGIKI